jgi:wyosine [tRNA(Phe)-imidazoG37] synthetase (radical SAM superfamily)
VKVLSAEAHPRDSLQRQYVYSVLSRRAGGISLGVNLNPDSICNWACAYCQVAREDKPKQRLEVDFERAAAEISELLESVADGSLLKEPLHRGLPSELRHVVDLSFSGDGEPTTCPHFPALLEHVIAEKSRLELRLELVILSNNSMAHRPSVGAALRRLAEAGGRLHAKLDAGDEAGYLRVDRSAVPWQRTLDNLQLASRLAPLTLQTLICAVDGVYMGADELDSYIAILKGLLDEGGQIAKIDLHSVARRPPFDHVKGLPLSFLQSLAERIEDVEPRLAGLVYSSPGSDAYLLSGAAAHLEQKMV